MRLEALRAVIEDLGALDPDVLSDPDAVVELHQLAASLDAVVARADAAFHKSAQWALDGARSAVAWLATRTHCPKGSARRSLRLGRGLRNLPVAERAWLEGRIESAHVAALVAARTPATAEAMARDEALLVEQAATLSFTQFSSALAYWRQLADPDGAEVDHQAMRDKRAVYLDAGFDGSYSGSIYLDPISGAIVSGQLKALEQKLFEQDWAAAKQALGRDPLVSELARTPAQRRSDALVSMAIRSAAVPEGAKIPAPLFSVMVDFPTLSGRICELADGTVIAPGALLEWLDKAYIERAVFGPAKRVDVSAKARLFTGATRRAIELRDRRCMHPYCDAPLDLCQVDHIIPFTAGGPTTQENGRLLCGFHNRLRHRPPPPPNSGWSPPRRT